MQFATFWYPGPICNARKKWSTRGGRGGGGPALFDMAQIYITNIFLIFFKSMLFLIIRGSILVFQILHFLA